MEKEIRKFVAISMLDLLPAAGIDMKNFCTLCFEKNTTAQGISLWHVAEPSRPPDDGVG
jgi:hypothetical protein